MDIFVLLNFDDFPFFSTLLKVNGFWVILENSSHEKSFAGPKVAWKKLRIVYPHRKGHHSECVNGETWRESDSKVTQLGSPLNWTQSAYFPSHTDWRLPRNFSYSLFSPTAARSRCGPALALWIFHNQAAFSSFVGDCENVVRKSFWPRGLLVRAGNDIY